MEKGIFLLALLSTLFMTGLIWFVQVVHYPLFAKVGPEGFALYESLHTQRTGLVVAPVMLLELLTTCLLLISRPPGISSSLAISAVVLVGIIWLSTMFLQVPLHGKLAGGSDLVAIGKLVRSNWIRTVAWTLKSGVMGWMLWESWK
jgi:hypothetical protein